MFGPTTKYYDAREITLHYMSLVSWTTDVSVIVARMEENKEDSTPEPDCSFLSWTAEEVAAWIKSIGYPFYQDCFIKNYIDGKKLIMADASTLCKLGIRDFQHIKDISAQIRQLIYLEEPDWNRSISLPPRSDWGMFLEIKSKTGKEVEDLEFEKFKIDHQNTIWQPPLDNAGKMQTCLRRKQTDSQQEINGEKRKE